MTRRAFSNSEPSRAKGVGAGGVLQRKCACGTNTAGGGDCGNCEKKARRLQRLSAPGPKEVAEVPEVVHEALRSNGRPLDGATRSFMESRFGHDFSGVRVHTDALAQESARSVNALAYTVGSDIVLGAGQYAPQTGAGRRLLAHELTHVVQQQGAHARVQSMSVEEESSPAEAEAERMSREVSAGGIVSPVRETMRAGRVGRVAGNAPASAASAPSTTPAGAPANASAPTAARGPSKPQGLRIDVLGADVSVKDSNVRAAAQALGTDMRVGSLEDMISKLEQTAGAETGRCVEHLAIWNHGSPARQALAGTETIERKGGKPYSLPYSGLTLDWLLSQGNQAALNRLRKVFCCGAKMQWMGCGSAGVEAEGGLRTEAEQSESKLRYVTHGSRYKDAQDAADHGASLIGATFGNLNVQSWADATCTTVNADNDFTYISPTTPKRLFYAGHGGKFVAFPPQDPARCTCDPATGRPRSAWNVKEGKQFIREKEEAALGGDYLWHLYLQTFRAFWKQRQRPEVRADVIASMRRLILEAAAKIAVPSGLPVGDVRPWTNVDTAEPEWAAVTSPHLVFCFPDNCWRWIMVNQKAIQTTPSHTQQTLAHELLHADDMWKAAQEFKRVNGDPPEGAGDRCKPAGEGVRKNWTDAWGQYVNKFVDFFEGKTGAQRHVDIYAESVKPHWAKLTMQEKVNWFGGALQNVPPDLPASKTFEAEQMVLDIFKNPRPEQLALRQELAAVLARVAAETVLGDANRKVDLGKGRTLLRHFGEVWKLRPDQRVILLRSMDIR